jgi:hypothetical protein
MDLNPKPIAPQPRQRPQSRSWIFTARSAEPNSSKANRLTTEVTTMSMAAKLRCCVWHDFQHSPIGSTPWPRHEWSRVASSPNIGPCKRPNSVAPTLPFESNPCSFFISSSCCGGRRRRCRIQCTDRRQSNHRHLLEGAKRPADITVSSEESYKQHGHQLHCMVDVQLLAVSRSLMDIFWIYLVPSLINL